MDLYEAAKTLRIHHYGWIDPEGNFIVCDMYRHFSELEKRGVLLDSITEMKELEEQLDRDESDWVANLEPGEHPEWHAFSSDAESQIEQLREKILSAVYGLGWIRVGHWNHLVELEGAKSHEKRMKAHGRDLSECLGVELGIKIACT